MTLRLKNTASWVSLSILSVPFLLEAGMGLGYTLRSSATVPRMRGNPRQRDVERLTGIPIIPIIPFDSSTSFVQRQGKALDSALRTIATADLWSSSGWASMYFVTTSTTLLAMTPVGRHTTSLEPI